MVKIILFAIAVTTLTASPSFVMAGHTSDHTRLQQIKSVDTRTIPVEDSLLMGNPKGSQKLYVFTDPDCPSCRKFHAELKQLERIAPGLTIHVMLFPLLMHPAAYDKTRVLIARKSSQLLDWGFEGKELPRPIGEEGKDSVDTIIRFAKNSRISRTPTVVMPDGKMVVGGMSAEALKQMLDCK